jgi:hypothetical protein
MDGLGKDKEHFSDPKRRGLRKALKGS